MGILSVTIDDLQYKRPGLNKILFTAYYHNYARRGTIVYDSVGKKFMSHNKDIDLLAAVCKGLSQSANLSK